MMRKLLPLIFFSLLALPSPTLAAQSKNGRIYNLTDGKVTVERLNGTADLQPLDVQSSAKQAKQVAAPLFATVAKAGPTVSKVLSNDLASAAIDQETYDNYSTVYSDAVSTWKSLAGNRRQNLGSVIYYLKRLAASKQLTVPRMPAVFAQLDRNTQWWGSQGTPATGSRQTFGDSLVIYQYYPGLGLQMQALANCGAANGYWQGKKYSKQTKLLDELMAMRVQRSAGGQTFSVMEYYFPFGGGSPPWFSGMADATCMQALTRAAAVSGNQEYANIATEMLPQFEIKTKRGVRVPHTGGNWYALYNFAPSQYVLNAQLQTLTGLYDFAQATGNKTAQQLFDSGSSAVKASFKNYDTGAWSLYQPGQEADLNYHKVQTGFLKNLCERTSEGTYCSAHDRFVDYLHTPATVSNARALPATVKRGRTTSIVFNLSKIARVGLTVRNSAGGSVYSTSAQLGHGTRKLLWTPAKKGSYTFSLSSKDLAGNWGKAANGSLSVN